MRGPVLASTPLAFGLAAGAALCGVASLCAVLVRLRSLRGASDRAEARLRTLVSQIPVVTYIEVIGPAGPSLLHMSPQIERWLGYPISQWLEDSSLWDRLIHPDDRQRVSWEEARANATGSMFQQDYRLLCADGSWRWVRDEAMFSDVTRDGRLVWQGVLSDITERKEAEERLADSARQYRVLFDANASPMWVYDCDTRVILAANAAAISNYGYSRERFLSMTVDDIDADRTGADPDADGGTWKTASLPSLSGLRRHRLAGGRTIDVEIVETSVPFSGSSSARLLLAHDVTERLRVERILRRSLSELRQLHDQRRRLLSRVVSAHEEERLRIASDIHDDSIQQMAVVALRLDMLSMDHPDLDRDDGFQELTESVRVAIDRLRNLMFDLRPYALDRDGLTQALREYLKAHQEEPGFPAATVTSRLRAEPEDETRVVLYRLAQESIINARKHARAANLSVSIEERGSGYALMIVDDGVGFRVEETQESAPGHLGLTAMRERVELLGGHFHIESNLGRGTRVSIWVPKVFQRKSALPMAGT